MFKKADFLTYCEEEYPTAFAGMSGLFLRSTVEGLVDYALNHFNVSKGQVVYFLHNILEANMELGEIAQFENDADLPLGLLAAKREWRNDHPFEAKFLSVWDDGETAIYTRCTVDARTKEVYDIERRDVGGLEHLDEECVVVDGIQYPVCRLEGDEIPDHDPGFYWYC